MHEDCNYRLIRQTLNATATNKEIARRGDSVVIRSASYEMNLECNTRELLCLTKKQKARHGNRDSIITFHEKGRSVLFLGGPPLLC